MSERPPERIYLQWPEGDPDCAGEAFGGATWCGDRINPEDVEYVRSDVVARLTAERDGLRKQRDRLDIESDAACCRDCGWIGRFTGLAGSCPECQGVTECVNAHATINRLRSERDDARRRLEQAAWALAEFGEHGGKCPLSLWEAGEPRADGYYHKYAGVWYAPGERPECECGLGAAIAAAAGAQP